MLALDPRQIVTQGFFSSYKICGIYSQKSVHTCIFNPIILSHLPIYYLVDNILNHLCEISPFYFSYSYGTELSTSSMIPFSHVSHSRHFQMACGFFESKIFIEMLPFVICFDLRHHMGVHKIPLLIYRKIIAWFDLFTLIITKPKRRKSKYCNTIKSLMSRVACLPHRET